MACTTTFDLNSTYSAQIVQTATIVNIAMIVTPSLNQCKEQSLQLTKKDSADKQHLLFARDRALLTADLVEKDLGNGHLVSTRNHSTLRGFNEASMDENEFAHFNEIAANEIMRALLLHS